MDPTSPGWYPDPQGTGGERWFDGTNWSADNVRPAPGSDVPPPPPGYAPPPPPPQYGDAYSQQPGGAYGQPGAPLPPPVSAYTAQPANASNTLSIIGIVCGVIALIFCPPGFGIAGIVLGIVGRKKGERLGTTAIVVAAIGLVLGMIIAVALFASMRH